MAVKPRPKPKTKTAPAANGTSKTTRRTPRTKATSAAPSPKSAPKPKPKATASKAKAAPKATKAKAAPKTEPRSTELDLHGFQVGSDSALIAAALIEGGESRKDATAKAAKAIEKTNGLVARTGSPKNVASLTSGILGRLIEAGYTVEESFRVVPPKEVQDAMKKEAAAVKRAATRKANARKK